MGDAAGWWARKLGTTPAPSSTPDTWSLPRHAAPTPAYAPAPPPVIPQVDALVADEHGQVHVGDAIVRWRGGDGMAERMHCPRCAARGKQGNLMFSRSHGQGQRIGLINKSGQQCAPAPICFECGYNGLYEPFGGDLNGLAG